MKDSRERELRIGQTVAFSYGHTSTVYTSVILRFTKKMVVIIDPWGSEAKKNPYGLLIIKG